jgi:hypothetical protein
VIDVFLEVLTRAQLRSPEEGRALMALLEEVAPDWLPGRWGHDEPLSRTYEGPSQIDELWAEDELLWRGRNAKVQGWVAQPHARQRYGLVHLGADSRTLDVAQAVTALERLGLAFEADYGFLHLVTPNDRRGAAPGSVEYVADDEPSLFVAEHRLSRWLPDIYWGNLLGPPYVELFGRERILSAPAQQVEQVGPELFYLQLTERLEDLRDHWDDVAAVRDEVKRHLGENAFWNAALGDSHAYDVPRLAPSAA